MVHLAALGPFVRVDGLAARILGIPGSGSTSVIQKVI
jgi:hypothetical protein